MKYKAPIIGLLGLALIAFGVNRYILAGGRSPLMGFRSETHNEYEAIKLGESIPEVTKRLGTPIKTGSTLLLPQRNGFEREFKKAEESNATIYYLWMNGANWYYSIGFDSREKVAVKAEGHS